MQPPTHDYTKFLRELNDLMRRKPVDATSIKITKKKNIYNYGDRADNIYFVESGQIKLVVFSPTGKECLLDIHGSGSIFGELCISGISTRMETATAIKDTALKQILCRRFLMLLSNHFLIEDFMKYLTARILEQQQIISNLVLLDKEHVLAETLLRLGRKLGKGIDYKLIESRITHEELSAMVGTTRPRITDFMIKFRRLGLINKSPDNFLIIKEKKLVDYLTHLDALS